MTDNNSHAELETAAAFDNFGDTGNLDHALVELLFLFNFLHLVVRHSVLHRALEFQAAFARAIGRPELATDPRFESSAARAKHAPACVAILDEAFASRPR
ncbi:MAG: hypothetical protein EHM81_02460, partial [Chloroflexi bacterium]